MINLEDLFTPIPLEIEEKPLAGVKGCREAKYFSIDEAVAYLDVSKRQVYRYIKAGKLKPHYRKVKGRKRLYLYSNQLQELYPTIRRRGSDNTALEGFLMLGEMIALGLCEKL